MTAVLPNSLEPTRSEVLACLLSGEETDVLELAAKTGLSQSTVFRSVDQLLQVPNLLHRRVARHGGRGRPTTKVMLNRRYSVLVGVVLDSSTTRLVLTDVLGQAWGERRVETPLGLPAAELADWLVSQARDLCAQMGEGSPLGALAVGLPGALTRNQEEVVGSLNLPVIAGSDFVDRIRSTLDVPVRFENDSHAALLGELSYGNVDPSGAVVLVTMSTGLSAAVSVDGEILVGSRGSLGEFGRLSLSSDGLRVEDLLSEAGLTEHLRASGREVDGDRSCLAELDGGSELRTQVDGAFDHLLAIIALAYEPHTILITGGFSAHFGEERLASATRWLADRVLVHSEVRRADLGDDSAVLGAIALATAAQFAEFGVSENQLVALPPASLIPDALSRSADLSESSGVVSPVDAR